MTNYQLTILRTIANFQPIMKDDLYGSLSIGIDRYYYHLTSLRDEGYIQFERMKGPVWLTVRGREAIEKV